MIVINLDGVRKQQVFMHYFTPLIKADDFFKDNANDVKKQFETSNYDKKKKKRKRALSAE